jgi:hypothetical protein
MGAWGLGLFESDHDHDRISYMDDQADLYDKLIDKALKRAKQAKSKPKKADARKPTSTTNKNEAAEEPNLTLLAQACDDVDLVREHLDSGALPKLIKHYLETVHEKSEIINAKNLSEYDQVMAEDEHDRAVYDFVLLGACAMSLGCKITDTFKEELIKRYRTTQFQRDALGQLQVALGDGPNRYKGGVPYQFPGLEDLPGDREREDCIHPNSMLINVWAPFGMHRDTRVEKREYPANVCGGCGAKDRLDGQPLLSCSKCKTKKYCGRVCQQAHFKQHKRVCKPQ